MLWRDIINNITYKDLEQDMHKYRLLWKVTKQAIRLKYTEVTVLNNLTEGKVMTKP